MPRVKATDLIDYTRASNGTALAKVSYGTELVTNGDFSDGTTGWTASVSSLSIESGALKITSDGVAGNKSAYQVISGLSVGNVYEISVDVIAETGPITQEVRVGTAINGISQLYEYIYETDSTNIFRFVAGATSQYISILFYDNTGDVTKSSTFDNISVKEVLFDQPDGTLQLFNHPTNIPRIEYDADGNLLGLLIEESRTNLLTYSQSFESQWFKARLTVLQNQAQAPDGSNTAVKVVPNTDNNIHYLYQTYSAGTHTWTIYAKAGEYGRISLWEGGVTAKYTSFDLNSGIKLQGNADADSITPVGNGWYRLSMTVTVASGTPYFVVSALNNEVLAYSTSFVGDGTSGIYIWGAQLEAGAFPTSYIPTSGATATRAADVASIPVSEFGYNQSEGTVVVEAKRFGTSSEFPRIAQLTDGTASERISVSIYGAGNTAYANVYDGGVSQASLNKAVATGANTYAKLGFGFANNDFAFAVDGVVEGTDTSGSVPDNISEMLIGDRVSANQQLNGHIKSIRYFPRRLTNATLQELTK